MDHFELTLDPRKSRQLALYDALRHALRTGRLEPGDELPSSRSLGEQLGIARQTVVMVFDRLKAEGSLVGVRGSGTKVSSTLPDTAFEAIAQQRTSKQPIQPALSTWARRLHSPFEIAAATAPRPFQPHFPAIDAFPLELWTQLVARRARKDDAQWLGLPGAAGSLQLRKAIAAHLRLTRAIDADPECVVILPSTQQVIDVIARLILEPGDPVWMEDPGYVGTRAAFEAHHAKIIPVPVDAEGINVKVGIEREPNAKLAYVTPGHQWPLGATMSLERRLELLAWARKHRRYVIEDDYDSEYHYEGRPVPALKSLDTHDLVIHTGAFSKTMLPTLRLAYAVLPQALMDPFLAARSILDRHTPPLLQTALTDFIEEGHFGRHLRRMRVLYAERRMALLDALDSELRGAVTPLGARAGLSLAVLIKPTDTRVVERLKKERVLAMPLSPTAQRAKVNGLLLGFAPYAPARLKNAVQTLARHLQIRT